LYVPAGAPHEVENIGTGSTVAISGNFFDQTNVQDVLEHLQRKLEKVEDPRRVANLQRTLNALDEIEWPTLEEDCEQDRPDDVFPCHIPLQEKKMRSRIRFAGTQ